MLAPMEAEEIRQFIYQELAHLQEEVACHAGSYTWLCLVDGCPTFTHSPMGRVIQQIVRPLV